MFRRRHVRLNSRACLDGDDRSRDALPQKVATDTVDRARVTPAVGMALADEILGERSGATDAPNAVTHTCQLPANLPCEDVFYAAVFRDRRHMHKGWGTWAIFDGHAGPWTAEVLSGLLPLFLAPRLDAAEYFKRRYIPNDPIIINAIKTAFLQLDFFILDYAAQLIQQGGPLAHVVSGAAHAFSGSCALLALYDPTHSVLRLANVGDSRAVLGRWDGTKYVCEPMSVDHTGFNPDEVSRLQREHPGEHGIVDPRSGRVHGLATSRAFGDS